MRRMVAHLVGLSRPAKRAIMVGADFCTIPLALWSAISLRLGSLNHAGHDSAWLYVVAALSSIPIFGRFGLYRAVLRYIAGRAVLAILAGVTASVVVTLATDKLLLGRVVPDSAYVIYFFIAMLYVWGSRTAVRHFLELVTGPRTRIIIYGAGESGVSLAMALKKNRDFQPIAFVDDDPGFRGNTLHGLEVFSPDTLEPLIARFGVSRVLLALPSMPRSKRTEIIRRLLALGVHVQTVPDFSDIVSGRAHMDEVHDLDIADLLGRDPVPPHPELLAACITDKVVMVTGAGGSIGSELCRQIVRLRPKCLILLEMSELALYSIDRELRLIAEPLGAQVEIVSLIGNAYQKQRVRDVMQAYRVQTVYHAAAYKHVPIVEQNVIQGISNNVMGTFHTAEAAAEAGVEIFVLISTDKAVNPTNVMGATKRVAELVLQGMHQRGFVTKFCMVRFGNVLDSSGSVVPLFRDQIVRGGPVTVTHPEVMRYFMTIPEAAQLVIQAGSMAHGGEVFVLDMGQPMLIVDLAKRMIGLMHMTVRDDANPDGDIAIEYTGLRSGEKLFEELVLGDNVTRTDHPMILRAREYALPWKYVRKVLDDLAAACKAFDCQRAICLLADAVAEYQSPVSLGDLVAIRRIAMGLDADNVTELPARRRTNRSDADNSLSGAPAQGSGSSERAVGDRSAATPPT
ncbi:MAG: nucleoside-diphosphate sugar epimerase/dehydratase [Steroidobacteraceae bacterium]